MSRWMRSPTPCLGSVSSGETSPSENPIGFLASNKVEAIVESGGPPADSLLREVATEETHRGGPLLRSSHG